MVKKKIFLLTLLVAVDAVVAGCSLNTPVAVTPRSNILEVPYVTQGSLNPGDKIWQESVPLQVPLTGMDIKGEWSVKVTPTVEASALRDDNNLYFSLSWLDNTKDDKQKDIDAFMDAAAVQLPIKSGAEPYICMGQENGMVNILFWRAGRNKGESMLAGGQGTLTSNGKPDLPVNSVYQNGRWTIVIVRPLAQEEKIMLTGNQLTSAFAVWNGADQQRGGRKSTSQWITLSFGKSRV